MKPVKQKVDNDCFRACMSSILELPNSDKLPHISSDEWWEEWQKLLEGFGISVVCGNRDVASEGYWIANVPSLNYKAALHSIVMKSNSVEFDPSNKNTYKKGEIITGKLRDSIWLEIDDISKLGELDNYREFLTKQEELTDDRTDI